MRGRQSVRVTYAHKRRRGHSTNKKLHSSPLEVLPPEMDDLTRTQMARRMLKRSRRVALAEQLEDKNTEHIREHLAKRIKRTHECVSDPEPTEVPFDAAPQDDLTFQTPFPSQSAHEPSATVPLVLEQLSPVPVAKLVMSRTSSRNLKENSAHSQILASPFNSRPGSATSSPKHKGRGQSSRRVSRIALHAKSRTLSGLFKEDPRRVSRKDSTVSLKDTDGEPPRRRIKHQRYPSSPSTSYMRSQFEQEGWFAPPKPFPRIDYDKVPSPGGFVHRNASFYADRPLSCSTPPTSRLRKLPVLHGCQTRSGNLLASHKDSKDASGPDVEMMDCTVPPRRQTIHLAGNSIFSSSGEFTIGSLPTTHNGRTILERDRVAGRDEAEPRVASQTPARCKTADSSQTTHSQAGFIAEYDIPLPNSDRSPASTAATKTLDSDGIPPKVSVGKQSLGFPGTSPAHGGNIVIRSSRDPGVAESSVTKQSLSLPGMSPAHGKNLIRTFRNPDVAKSSVGERLIGLPGTSPARGENVIIRTSRNQGTLTPPASPPNTTVSCPASSPASELALELQTMDIRAICGAGCTHSDGESHCPLASIPLQARSHSLQDTVTESTAKKSVKRRPARNRAGTIRASDFAKPSAPGLTISNVRRTRSGTVVGPDSKLGAKGAGSSTRTAKVAPTRLAAVQSGSESESDDELLLKDFWTEDLEYLGLALPANRKDDEADELNLGGLWHGLEFGPPRRPGLRRR